MKTAMPEMNVLIPSSDIEGGEDDCDDGRAGGGGGGGRPRGFSLIDREW